MLIYLFSFLPSIAFAGIIDSYESVLSISHGLLSSICFLSGGVMLFSSLAQYKLHRNNPSEVKLKIPLTLLVLGGLLLALSYMPAPV